MDRRLQLARPDAGRLWSGAVALILLGGAMTMGESMARGEDLPADADAIFGVWWRGGRDVEAVKKEAPYVRGVFASFHWSELEPEPEQYNWKLFDDDLARYARAGLYIQFIVMVGPDSPKWIYSHGVPEVKCTVSINPRGVPHKWTSYPYYLAPEYKTYYHRLIRAVADRIDKQPADVRKMIVCCQTAEGTTGDEGGYKGRPLESKYAMPEEEWVAFKLDTWKLFDELYTPKRPTVHLLINSGNQGQYHDWLMKNRPQTWRKAGNPGHGYQLNNEMDMCRFLDPIVNHYDRKGNIVRCRSEMDELFKGWFSEAPVWNMYWLNLWCLTFGIDIFQHTTAAFTPANAEGFVFYNKYGGQKDPAQSPGAWCALRDGLDAGDTQRFPIEAFGPGKLNPRAEDQSEGIQRCLNIIKTFEKYGARQGDPQKAMTLVMQNRDAKAMNDAGWNIWADNYQRYMKQYDPNGTSQGYWRVGPKDQPYGRFARGFDVENGKDAMCFDVDERLWAGDKAAAPKKVELRVVYFDQGKGSWALEYDAAGDKEKVALEVANSGTGRWKEAKQTVDDALFANRCPNNTDLMLVNTSKENTLFHLIEVTKR